MNRQVKTLLFILATGYCFFVSCSLCMAQADSSYATNNIKSDSIPTFKPEPFQPNPKKAGLYSAILPGLGQVYNRQVWKVPVIYAGLAVAGYFLLDNLTQYQSYRKAYIGRINNSFYTDEYTGKYDQSQLNQLQNDYNKFLDLTVVYTVLGFGLQIMDAITSAHLKNFDVSRDISLKIKPVLAPNTIGMGLVMKF